MKIPNIRWIIAGLLFLAAVLNYIDRQVLSILAPTIQRDLKMDDTQYGHIVNLFLVAYTVSLLVSGRLVDKIGARASMAGFIGWWSISNMATGFARSAASLGAARFSLGLGEAGNWPSSTKAVSEWFTVRERAFAIGLYTMGASLGATIAPWLILHLSTNHGWQGAFFATGAMGLVWLIPWLVVYRPPAKHPWITDRERERLLVNESAAKPQPASVAVVPASTSWSSAFLRRDVWLLMLARMITDPVWFFYQFWFAKYLFSARGVPQDRLGKIWVVYLAADDCFVPHVGDAGVRAGHAVVADGRLRRFSRAIAGDRNGNCLRSPGVAGEYQRIGD